jgi:hypothetical protein
MASRLTPRLKELRKKLGMIPIEVAHRAEEKADIELAVEMAELAASHAIALHAKGISGWSINPSTMEIVYLDGRRESMLNMPPPDTGTLPRRTFSDRLRGKQS